jgi:membrane-bound lytic murein transglycosylase D
VRDAAWAVRRRLLLLDPSGRAQRVLVGAALAVVLTAGALLFDGGRDRRTTGAPGGGSASPGGAPELPPLPGAFDGTTLADVLRSANLRASGADELLASPVLADADFTRAVHGWVDYWSGAASPWFPGFLERMGVFGPTVDSALAANGLPPSMRYLPLIESGYDPRVRSRARAVGLWQLMASTADELGLEVSSVVDERRHVHRSTGAALDFVGRLHDEFGSWFVVLAAYNAGPSRVRAVLRRHAPGQEPTDSLFWALRGHFPRETREFLPKLYGAMWVASRPGAYGYGVPSPEPYVFDVVAVPDATTLHVVALAAGAEYHEVVRLNPEYVQAVTPEDRVAQVRVPPGRARTFRRIYPRIHPAERTALPPQPERRAP